jgi:hypothetical protein
LYAGMTTRTLGLGAVSMDIIPFSVSEKSDQI